MGGGVSGLTAAYSLSVTHDMIMKRKIVNMGK